MSNGLTPEHANRLREDFKRAAGVQKLIKLRQEEQPLNDEAMRILIKLLLEEYDALHRNFEGMLTGTNGRYNNET